MTPETFQFIGAMAGGVVGGLIGSWRSLHKVAKEAADLAVKAHEEACAARRDPTPYLTPSPSGSWRLKP